MARSLIGNRRSAIEIVSEILSVCRNGTVNKTAIMYRSNLSFEQLQRYLAFLHDQRLLHRQESGQYAITSRGHEILSQINEVMDLLRGLQSGQGGDIDGNGNSDVSAK